MILPSCILNIEKWKFNKEFNIYVSTLGHFKTKQKKNIPIKIDNGGYCRVKTECGLILAHRLVLITWRPIPNREHQTVDHLNHNKRDNSLKNLEWVSLDENHRRARRDQCNYDNLSLKETLKNMGSSKIKINNLDMTIKEAFEFITYNLQPKIKSEYIKSFPSFISKFMCENINTSTCKYGYTWQKVEEIY